MLASISLATLRSSFSSRQRAQAGLFSAVVTTFVVQTSQSLTPDWGQTSASLLTELVALQRAAAENIPISDVPRSPMNSTTQFSIDLSTRAVNVLWFTSLALSLSAALMCILVKQWVQNYTSAISGPPRDRAFLRHMRFDGVRTWKMRDIIGLLPLALHTSLIFFFAGMVIFLIPLDEFSCAVVAIIAGLTYTSYLTSAILPIFYLACPYRTPLSEYIDVAQFVFAEFPRTFGRIIGGCLAELYHAVGNPRRFRGLYHVLRNALHFERRVFVSMKVRVMNSIQYEDEEIVNLTVAATNWLLETTTRPSATNIVYQSYAGFSFIAAVQICSPVLGFENRLSSTVRYTSSLTSDPSDTYRLQRSIENLERMSRALVKICSSRIMGLGGPDYNRVVDLPEDLLAEAGAILERYSHLLREHHISSLHTALDALTIDNEYSIAREIGNHRYARLRLRLLEHKCQELLDRVEIEDNPNLWPFSVYMARLPYEITPQVVFNEFRNRLRMVLILCRSFPVRRPIRVPSLSTMPIPAIIALYMALYPQDIHALDAMVLTYGGRLNTATSLEVQKHLCISILAVVTGFTDEHPEWLIDPSAREAIARCLEFATNYLLSLLRLSGPRTATEIIMMEHTERCSMWRWKGKSIRDIWYKDVARIANSIITVSQRDALSLYQRGIIIHNDNGLHQALLSRINHVGRDYMGLGEYRPPPNSRPPSIGVHPQSVITESETPVASVQGASNEVQEISSLP